jgi:hypothetical protein
MSWKNGNTLRTSVLIVMSVGILVPSMLGFVAKFIEFIHTFRGSTDGAFAITPMLNYLLASMGFFCMLVWAIFNGMFRDMEGPKFDMLELEDELNAATAIEQQSK